MSTTVTAHHALLYLIGHSPEDANACGISLPLTSQPGGASLVDPGLSLADRAASSGHAGEAVNDVPGFITIDAEKQQIIVEVMVPGRPPKVFVSKAPYQYTTTTKYLPTSAQHVPGTFYTRHQDPNTWATSSVFIQQYPTYQKGGSQDGLLPPPPGETVAGRVVVDFWNNSEVIGVFKTDAENYGAGATGKWEQ